jgi:DNA-binding NarL/FixJ family response regulator
MNKITILLIDDHAIVREGYRSLLQKQSGFEVVGEASNANEAYEQYKQLTPDIVITDISLPGQSGIKVIEKIKAYDEIAKILVFSMHQHADYVIQATRAGALGYITKSSDPEVLIRAVESVNNHVYTLSDDVTKVLAHEQISDSPSALRSLSHREFEILRHLIDAKTNQEISDLLNISPKTVSNSHYIIKKKLGVNSDIELTRLAIKLNLLEVEQLSNNS